MTKRTNNKENKHIAKVFWANQKFFEQKVCEMFKKDGVSKHSPEYKGRYLVVNVEQYQGKYYLSFGRMGWALSDYAKRIRKTMTMAQIDDLIAEYYDKEDEAHKKAVETYNNSVRIGGTKNTKKTTTKTTTTEPVAEVEEVAPVTESYTELQDKNRPDYQNLYNEFLPKFHFSLGGGVGSFYFVLSNGKFCFGVRKSDKRCYFGTKNLELFATYNAEEMRKYLTGYVIE